MNDAADGGEEDQEYWREDRSVLQIKRLKGRKRFWAFGGVRFKDCDKLQVNGKNCFIVKRNHQDKCEVVRVYHEDKENNELS